jgi:hypothetical protein
MLRYALCVLLLACLEKSADAHDGQIIHGDGFEGVILTPSMMGTFSGAPPSRFNTGTWIVSSDLVRRAERHLPQAIDQRTPPPQYLRTYYVPQYYTPKGTAPLPTQGHTRLETAEADSITMDNFLNDVRPDLANYKRQYLGVTLSGKKYLFINFVFGPDIADDPYLQKTWRNQWVAVLGGGDDFWSVLYDPATGTVSEWE